jgi:xanthosine utilization system XapX-like protein
MYTKDLSLEAFIVHGGLTGTYLGKNIVTVPEQLISTASVRNSCRRCLTDCILGSFLPTTI